MESELYSVEQVAERLGLHVRTIRGYVRDGRLKAVRIGKQYRIAREDLEALTGRPVLPADRESVRRRRFSDVSAVVAIDAISPEEVQRLSNTLVAAAGSRAASGRNLRIETVYEEEQARLKVVIVGALGDGAEMLRMIEMLLEGQS